MVAPAAESGCIVADSSLTPRSPACDSEKAENRVLSEMPVTPELMRPTREQGANPSSKKPT